MAPAPEGWRLVTPPIRAHPVLLLQRTGPSSKVTLVLAPEPRRRYCTWFAACPAVALTIKVSCAPASEGGSIRGLMKSSTICLAPEVKLRLVEKPDGPVHSELIEEGIARCDQLFVARLSGERYIRGRNKSSVEFVSRQKLMVWKRE